MQVVTKRKDLYIRAAFSTINDKKRVSLHLKRGDIKMTLTEKLHDLYKGICKLPVMPVIAGLALGASLGAASVAKAVSVKPSAQEVTPKTYNLESALGASLEKVEKCSHARIAKGEEYILGECLDDGYAHVRVGDKGVSFSCFGKECPTEVEVTYFRFPRDDGELKEVKRTFPGTDFALTVPALVPDTFGLYAPYLIYGAVDKTSGIQAAIKQAETRLRRL